MVFVFRFILSALTGSMTAAATFAPAGEVRRFFNNRARIVRSLVVGLIGLVVFLGDVTAMIVDLVIQIESRGFIAWNPVLVGLVSLFALSLVALFWSVATLPHAADFEIRPSAEELAESGMRLLGPLIKGFRLEKLVGEIFGAPAPKNRAIERHPGGPDLARPESPV